MNLKERACRANLELASTGLVMGTFGNLSIADRDAGVFAIKPSGVQYHELKPDKIVVVSLETGEPTSLPATRPVPVYEARVVDGEVEVIVE